MKITGYSERGILNALLYEISYSNNSNGLLNDLISRATFPFSRSQPQVGDAEILIEQSFSDFGDADALVLLNSDTTQRSAIFIEAKVKSYQTRDWKIEDEFSQFRSGLTTKANSSNLFTQLYFKYCLVRALREGGMPALQRGVPFPSWSSRKLRKIGSNKIVLRATELLQRNVGRTFFLAFVPDRIDRVSTFFHTLFAKADIDETISWDIETLGYLTWAQIGEFCEVNNLRRTLGVFEFNKGQIYAM